MLDDDGSIRRIEDRNRSTLPRNPFGSDSRYSFTPDVGKHGFRSFLQLRFPVSFEMLPKICSMLTVDPFRWDTHCRCRMTGPVRWEGGSDMAA